MIFLWEPTGTPAPGLDSNPSRRAGKPGGDDVKVRRRAERLKDGAPS